MPNTKRRFADDDPESDDDDYDEPVYRGGGKQLPMMGKQLQRPPPMEESDEESDSEPPVARGSGKHFGKQLRAIEHHDSEDDDDNVPVQPVARSRGKSLLRPPPQEDDDDDDDDDEDMAPIHVAPRIGKSLMRMRPPEEEEEDDDDDEPPPEQRGRGKSLMGMQSRGGGKQLRPPPPQDDDDDDDEDSDEDFEEESPMVVTRAPHGGGKQLRRPFAPKSESEEESSDDAMDIDESSEEEVVKKPAPKPRGRPKGKAKTPAKKTPSRAAKKKAQEPEDMEESDESSEEERELDMETFDTQALVENEEDQKYLDSLAEFEREAILGERFEKLKAAADMKKALRESKRKERELKKKETAKKKPAKGKGKKKANDTAGDAELAAKLSSARESTRNRDAAGTKAKKDAARAKLREERKTIIQQKDEEEEESELEFESDEDSDDDYEDAVLKPWQKKKAEKTSSRLDRYEEPSASSDEEAADVSGRERMAPVEATLEDYQKVTLPRRRLARWCQEPFFDRAVTGCFVRLFIGESEDGKKCYRLCEIVDVDKSKSEYKFPAASSRENPISTSKALKLRFGKNEKVFPMYLVSDSRPTDEDVKKYASVQKSSRRDVLGKREASRLLKKQHELVTNYTYTAADIDKNVAERKKTGKALTNLGSEQTRVAIAVQAAQSALEDAKRRLEDAKRAHLEASENDSEDLEKAIEDAEAALAEAKNNLNEKKEDEKRVLAVVEKRKKKLQRRQNWAKVNERAAKMNQNADFQSYKDQQAKKEAETMSGSTPRFNPYARRKVKPKILWEVGQKEEKKDDDATKTTDSETREEAAEAIKGDDQPMNDVPQDAILATQKTSFIGERHQFSIDEEALAPDTSSILGTSRKKQKISRTRKGLSLTEYQERKTAGSL